MIANSPTANFGGFLLAKKGEEMNFFSHNKLDYDVIKRSKYFNKKWYLETYPDVLKSGMNPIDHYLKKGWKEKHNPSESFDGNAYLKENMDVKNAKMNPLLHYERYGRYEGRRGGIKIKQKVTYNVNVIKKIAHYFNKNFAKLLYRNVIKQNKNKRVLVVLHLFYMESWNAIKLYLDNLKAYDYDLVVTYVRGCYDKRVLSKIKEFNKNVKMYMYPNRGFDIGPFLDVLQKINLADYDIVFKLHSKGIYRKQIYIYNQIFKNKDWFYNLYNGILGEFSVHKVMKAFSNNKNIGVVASKNLIVCDPKHKQNLTQEIAEKYKIKLHKNYRYVAGSCFAIRAEGLEKIKKQNLTIKNFSCTKRGIFSLAHAMERIICAMIEKQGNIIYGLKVPHPIYKSELEIAQKTSSLRLLDDRRFVLDDEFFYRGLEGKKIRNYYVKRIALGDINRSWKGKIFKLHECAPYIYLKGNSQAYNRYCKENKRMFNIEMSQHRFDCLVSCIESKGFNAKSMPVINAADNVIMDGQHRSCYLLSKFGTEHKVRALFIEFVKG
ncbi:MAG: hypothetical protein E7006_02600 [Alphaproteobacteria bacterium]|nr:hypothetical protein [Alphaproteobacteria bacterium]